MTHFYKKERERMEREGKEGKGKKEGKRKEGAKGGRKEEIRGRRKRKKCVYRGTKVLKLKPYLDNNHINIINDLMELVEDQGPIWN